MVIIRCKNSACRAEKEVRQADIDRGWGRYCSKSCKAVDQCRKSANGRNTQRHTIQQSHRLFDFSNRAEMIDAYEEAYTRSQQGKKSS